MPTFLGIKKALNGQFDEAIEDLQWVRDHGERTYGEYSLAIAELKRLEAVSRTVEEGDAEATVDPRNEATTSP